MSRITSALNVSPFDEICKTRPDGTEYWSARDLQPFMGYSKWQDFQNAVERAKAAAVNAGHDSDFLFVQVSQLMDAGNLGQQQRIDYELPRFACYLTFLNGDPRKPEVAAAQAYFAIRTREAETAPKPAELSRLDILKMALAAEEEKSVLEAALESAAPAIEYHERHIAENDDVCKVKVWGGLYGLTVHEAYELLVSKRIVYKEFLGFRWSESKGRKEEEYEYRPRAGRVTFEWFSLRPQHNAPRLHNGQIRQTLYVKQFFADRLAVKCGLSLQGELDAA